MISIDLKLCKKPETLKIIKAGLLVDHGVSFLKRYASSTDVFKYLTWRQQLQSSQAIKLPVFTSIGTFVRYSRHG